jgi:hypothetical protein
MDPSTMYEGAHLLAVEVGAEFVTMGNLQSRNLRKDAKMTWAQLEFAFNDSYVATVPNDSHLLIFSGAHTHVYLAPMKSPLQSNIDDIVKYKQLGDTDAGQRRADFQCTGHRSHSMSGARNKREAVEHIYSLPADLAKLHVQQQQDALDLAESIVWAPICDLYDAHLHTGPKDVLHASQQYRDLGFGSVAPKLRPNSLLISAAMTEDYAVGMHVDIGSRVPKPVADDPEKNASDGFENISLLVVPGQSTRAQKMAWVCNGVHGGLILFNIDIGAHFVSLASMVPHCTTLPEEAPDTSMQPGKPRYIGLGGVVKGSWYTSLEGHKLYFAYRDACLADGRRPEIVPSLYAAIGSDGGTGDGQDAVAAGESTASEEEDNVDAGHESGANSQRHVAMYALLTSIP